MRGKTFVMRNGRLVLKRRTAPLDGQRVHVISDDIGTDLEHTAYSDGRRTASKSVFRRWTREAGCVEKGNDRERPRPAPVPDLRADVARAIQMVNQGYRPTIQREWD